MATTERAEEDRLFGPLTAADEAEIDRWYPLGRWYVLPAPKDRETTRRYVLPRRREGEGHGG